ncbi:MAG: AAC(3) family N-acetyltransferase [Anaerolineae bacterium]|nr:AAC(3) family N-acetyltransferase [Anaerolineae bacterium]
MTEADIIARTPAPRTRASLARDLHLLGVEPGIVLLVHSSLSAVGWVNGGPVAVIQALQDVLTPEGTLVMPAHSGGLSDPAEWQNPPVPPAWVEEIRATMPAYDLRYTPTRGMGVIAELFRTWPDVLRSSHPLSSYCAWGQHARQVTGGHALVNSMGEQSPLARVYDLDGWVLLLGVGYDSNSSFHLAQYRAPGAPRKQEMSPMIRHGKQGWFPFDDVDLDADPFPAIGEAMEQALPVTIAPVGSATARLFRQRPAVDLATRWLSEHHRRANPQAPGAQ